MDFISRYRVLRITLSLAAPLALWACDPDPTDPDAGPGMVDSGPSADSGALDAGADSGLADAGPETDAGTDAGGPATPPTGFHLATAGNGGAAAGTIDRRLSGTLEADEAGTFDSATNQGVAFDRLGNLVQAGDGSAPLAAGIRTFCGGVDRLGDEDDQFRASADRSLTPGGLTGAKGLAVIESAGWYVVAAFGAMEIQVYSETAAGDAAPLHTVSIGEGTSVWDVEYDATRDRLFAALTNGSVAVYDDFVRARTAAPTRTFTQNNAAASRTNFHGIAYAAATDTLFVTDVAAATLEQGDDFASDGSIVVFQAASTLSGAVDADQVITGSSTMLGNPVDCVWLDGALYVAEKANDLVLAWAGIASLGSGDIAPTAMDAAVKPESIASIATDYAPGSDATDIDVSEPIGFVVTTQNPSPTPGGLAQNPSAATGTFLIQFYDPMLTSAPARSFVADEADGPGAMLGANQRLLENITFDQSGVAYATFDNASIGSLGIGGPQTGGVLILNRPSLRNSAVADEANVDRVIAGANTGLIHPKGIEVSSEAGVILVADTGSQSIRAFGLCAAGNVAPLFVVRNFGDAATVWDLDYDAAADRLFVAATDGTVLVYDAFLENSSADEGPTRVIQPQHTDEGAAVNLHGVIYDAERDQLYLSDVGAADDSADGALYRIANASIAAGELTVDGEIRGVVSGLGNPVDIAFDGARLFVAEKANGRILRFDNFASLEGDLALAPDGSRPATAPESVTVLPRSYASQTAP